MDILLTADKTLEQIAREFHQHFPGLKLEFFAHSHANGVLSAEEDRLPLHLRASEVGHCLPDARLRISGNQKVATLEKHFQEIFGIGVQVLRRSGNLWLQTGVTDGWTLSKQDREGRFDGRESEPEAAEMPSAETE
jgi:hypothetical protein